MTNENQVSIDYNNQATIDYLLDVKQRYEKFLWVIDATTRNLLRVPKKTQQDKARYQAVLNHTIREIEVLRGKRDFNNN